jgi:hypothetical protein
VAASAMRVLAVDSSVGSAVTGFVGMVSCGECNYNAQTQSVDGQWLSVGSVPFSMGRSVFLRAASTFMKRETKRCVGRPVRRRSESGHGGGWRLRVAAVANCEAADRFVNSASPHAAAPRSLTDRTRAQGAQRSGLAGREVAAVCAVVGARRPLCQERAGLQRGRPPTRGGDERWAAHRARRV